MNDGTGGPMRLRLKRQLVVPTGMRRQTMDPSANQPAAKKYEAIDEGCTYFKVLSKSIRWALTQLST